MLYKFSSIKSKSALGILNDQKVYFASAKSMNDPFEGKPYYKLPTRQEIKNHLIKRGAKRKNVNVLLKRAVVDLKYNQSDITSLFDGFSKSTGLLCFTPINDNLLMWSHYADSHKGLCFGFDISTPYDDIFGAGYEVDYSERYPEVSPLDLDTIMANQNQQIETETNTLERFATKHLYTKSNCWAYEKEVRFSRPEGAHGVGFLSFPKTKLKSITFGCNIDTEEKDKIIKIVKENFPGTFLYQAHTSEKCYKISIVAI